MSLSAQEGNLFNSFTELVGYKYKFPVEGYFVGVQPLWDSGKIRLPVTVDTVHCRFAWHNAPWRFGDYDCFDARGTRVGEYQSGKFKWVKDDSCQRCVIRVLENTAVNDAECTYLDRPRPTCEFSGVVTNLNVYTYVSYDEYAKKKFSFRLDSNHRNWRGLDRHDTVDGLKIIVMPSELSSGDLLAQLLDLCETMNNIQSVGVVLFAISLFGANDEFLVLNQLRHDYVVDAYTFHSDDTPDAWKVLSRLRNMKLLWMDGAGGRLPGVVVEGEASSAEEIIVSASVRSIEEGAFNGFPMLSRLYVREYTGREFPEGLLGLTRLKALYLNAPNLESIDLRDCSLDSLEILFLDDVKSLKHITLGSGDLEMLKILLVHGAHALESIEGLEHLHSLWTLGIQGDQRYNSIIRSVRRMENLGYFGVYSKYNKMNQFAPYRRLEYIPIPFDFIDEADIYDAEATRSGIGESMATFNLVRLK